MIAYASSNPDTMDSTATWDSPTATTYYISDSDNCVEVEAHNPYEELEKAKQRAFFYWLHYEWLEELRFLGRLARAPPPAFYLVIIMPMIRYRILRCNRHGLGLRIRG